MADPARRWQVTGMDRIEAQGRPTGTGDEGRRRAARALLFSSVPLWLAACASQPSSPTDWSRVVPPPGATQAPAGPVDPSDRSAQGPFQPNTELRLCRRQLSNAPQVDPVGFVVNFSPLVVARGRVVLAAAPVNDVCLSSGFGPRGGRVHEGIDLVARPAGTVYSAAPGIVREARWGTGFGWYVTLDHGHGVYTRYAHLAAFREDIRPGRQLGFGQPIGRMGQTGNATGVHLHYEVLTGHWGRRGSFGLAPADPLALPAFDPLLVAEAPQATSGPQAGSAP